MRCFTVANSGVFPCILTDPAGVPGESYEGEMASIEVGDTSVRVLSDDPVEAVVNASIGKGSDGAFYVVPLIEENEDERCLVLFDIAGGPNSFGNSKVTVRKGTAKADVAACDDVTVIARGVGKHGIHAKWGRYDKALVVAPYGTTFDIERSGSLRTDSELVTVVVGHSPVIMPLPTEPEPPEPVADDLDYL